MICSRRSCRWFVVFLLVAIGVPAWAGVSPHGPEGKRFGLGIVLGDPTGLTGKGYVSERLAVDGIVSWSFIDEAVTLIGDVTYDFFDLSMAGAAVGIPFYAGVGGKVAFDERGKNADRTLVGIRVPVGLAFQWAQHPIELFIEVAPGIELAPATTVDITGGLGARFYF